MRARLRKSTEAAHERMHAHDGFSAAATGAVSRRDYRDLLARLYGFHAAFDRAMRGAPPALAEALDMAARERAGLIAGDLAGLGAAPEAIAALPLCPDLPDLAGEGEFLGALYVVEGSTLGGAFIARALAPLVGEDRRFFLGHGGENGRLWRSFVTSLERLDAAPEAADAAERAANATFAAFERWMANWRGAFAPETAAGAI